MNGGDKLWVFILGASAGILFLQSVHSYISNSHYHTMRMMRLEQIEELTDTKWLTIQKELANVRGSLQNDTVLNKECSTKKEPK